MRIQYMSDWHGEHLRRNEEGSDLLDIDQFGVQPDTEVLILAGDMASQAAHFKLFYLLHQLTTIHPNLIVLYVAGNHEYYGHRKATLVIPEMRRIFSNSFANVHVLENEVFEHRSPNSGLKTLFLGTTLFSDLSNPVSAEAARRGLNDFRQPGMSVNSYQYRHNEAVEFLGQAFNNEDYQRYFDKFVVITHHAPSLRSISAKYVGNILNDCYISPILEKWDHAFTPDVWIHGHVHDPHDYEINGVRVLCNPIGYPNEHPGQERKGAKVFDLAAA